MMFDASAERSASISQFNCLKFQERLKRGKKGSLESFLAAKLFLATRLVVSPAFVFAFPTRERATAQMQLSAAAVIY